MRFIKRHPLIIIVILGLLIRFFLLYLDYSFDVNNHMVWGKDAVERGLKGFYEVRSSQTFGGLYPNYPPLAIYLFAGIWYIGLFIHSLLWWFNLHISLFPSKLMLFADTPAFLAGLFKLPSIVADLGCSILFYKFAKKLSPKDRRLPYLGLTFILFNPAIFYISAYWGQIDMIPIFFALASTYLLLFKKNPFISVFLFCVGLLFKPTILLCVPVFAFFFMKKNGFQKTIRSSFIVLLFFWISFLPFFRSGSIISFPFTIYVNKILADQYLQSVTNGAYNFWALIAGFKGIRDTTTFLFGVSYRVWGYMLTLISYIIVTLFVWKNKKKETIIAGLFITSYAAFLFLTKMHERYLILSLIPLGILALKNKSYQLGYILLSFILFLNLYHSWPVPHVSLLTSFLDSRLGIVSISTLNIGLFVYFISKLIRKSAILI